MLPGLRGYCHLPINFQCQVYYWATNGNPFMQFTLLLIASLWSIHVWFFFSYFCAQDNFKVPPSKEEVQVTKRGLSSFVCVYTHWTSPLGKRGQQVGVMLLKSTTPICLSVRCLAWLSSTQWWCWQNDRRGAHSSECQFGCKAPFPQELWSSRTLNQKRERAVVYKRLVPQNLMFK